MHFLPADTWRNLQAALADAKPTFNQPDLASVIAEILADFGVVPDYCREDERNLTSRRRNFMG